MKYLIPVIIPLIIFSQVCVSQNQSGNPQELTRPTSLKVAIYDEAPFGFATSTGEINGLMVELWEDIARELNFSFEYTLTNMDDLISGLNSHRYQIGLGAITVTPAREAKVDFTQPVNASGTGIIIARKNMTAKFRTYVWPISLAILKLAVGLVLLLLLSGVIVWFVERRHEKDPGHRDIDSIEDGLWWSAVTISTIGYGDKVPHTRLGRIFGGLWIFTGLVMLSLFTANASAIFTVTEIESHIQSNEDLRKARVGAAVHSSGAEYLIRERIEFTPYKDVKTAINAMIANEIDCVVSNVPVAKYLNNSKYKQKLTISNVHLLNNYMGIALTPNSELREPINRTLLRLIAEPKWQTALNRYLGD